MRPLWMVWITVEEAEVARGIAANVVTAASGTIRIGKTAVPPTWTSEIGAAGAWHSTSCETDTYAGAMRISTGSGEARQANVRRVRGARNEDSLGCSDVTFLRALAVRVLLSVCCVQCPVSWFCIALRQAEMDPQCICGIRWMYTIAQGEPMGPL